MINDFFPWGNIIMFEIEFMSNLKTDAPMFNADFNIKGYTWMDCENSGLENGGARQEKYVPGGP